MSATPPCPACECAATIMRAEGEHRDRLAGGMWVAAFLQGVGAASRGNALVRRGRAGFCPTHRALGDTVCKVLAEAMAKAETT